MFGAGVPIYIYIIHLFVEELNRTLAINLTFSNIHGRTSRQIYRRAL